MASVTLGEKKIGGELRKLFGHGKEANSEISTTASKSVPGPSASLSSSPTRDGLLARADNLCKQLRDRRGGVDKRNKRLSRRSVKELQKGLVLIDYKSDPEDTSLCEYQKLYDGSMRYSSDMTENDIKKEIVRLVKQKKTPTHDLNLIEPEDFDFVRCVNRHVKVIDGDAPFDACGINQVYKNGCI